MTDQIITPPAVPNYISPRVAAWHRKVVEEISDTAILVLGDSTGTENTPTRWPRKLADLIALQWPRQTVVYHPWDDATKTYPPGSAVTVQTGVSGRTIHLYNSSVSGQVIGYSVTNVGTLLSGIVPDVIILNYGHNSPQDLTNYRALTHQAVIEYRSGLPDAAIVITAQNPRATFTTGNTLATDYAPDQLRQRANFEYASAEGHPCVDVNSNFRAYGNYNSDLLVDGLHPNDAGSQRWANLTWDTIKPRKSVAPLSDAASRTQRVWIPAKMFDALDGAPAYGSYFGIGAWALDQTTEESVAAAIDFPGDWSMQNIDIYFGCATAPNVSARTIVLLGSHMYLGASASGLSASKTLGTWTDNAAGNVATNLSTTLGVDGVATLYNRAALSTRPLALKVTRKAADASDTLPQDLLFYGAMVQRMH